MQSKASKTAFFCSSCGAKSPKWVGKCLACGEWNTYEEEVIQRTEPKAWNASLNGKDEVVSKPILLSEIKIDKEQRFDTGDAELNRVLGGGLVPGSFVLIGGEPGIGKSTLMLQVALQMPNAKVLYVSGEESAGQLLMRAERIGFGANLCQILTETRIENVFLQAGEMKPELLVIDSIQTLVSQNIDSSAASISQIRECAAQLQAYAKQAKVSVFVIGHITKDGHLAGPKILEHIVDAVLQFEGDRNYGYRILRSVKNRFGSTNELGIYQMESYGLRQVSNPSEILLSQREEALSGTSVAVTMEGMRPILVEVQALVGNSPYATPQRSSTGFELRRLHMLLAVLEKRCGFRLSQKDVFVNIAGGIRVEDPAMDLSVVAAIMSSVQDISLSPDDCFSAEIGLTGEVRPVPRIEQRIAEADKLGFKRIFISKYTGNKGLAKATKNIELVELSDLFDVFKKLNKD